MITAVALFLFLSVSLFLAFVSIVQHNCRLLVSSLDANLTQQQQSNNKDWLKLLFDTQMCQSLDFEL